MYNIDLSPSEPAIQARSLPDLVAVYLSVQRTQTSRVTVDGYRNHLRRFDQWWGVAGPGVGFVLTPSLLSEYGDWLLDDYLTSRGEPLTAQGQFDSLRRLRQCFHWAYTARMTPVDLGQWVALPAKPVKVRRPVSLDVLARLLAACDLAYQPARARAIISFLAGTGCRRMECAGLLAHDVQLDADGSGVAWLGIAKGGPRWVAFDAHTGFFLRVWLDLSGWPAGPAFGLGIQGIYRTVTDAAEAAGLEDAIQGPHDLRRLFVTTWNRMQPGDGYAILLQRQVGHKSMAMTSLYDQRGLDDIRSALVSPVALALG